MFLKGVADQSQAGWFFFCLLMTCFPLWKCWGFFYQRCYASCWEPALVLFDSCCLVLWLALAVLRFCFPQSSVIPLHYWFVLPSPPLPLVLFPAVGLLEAFFSVLHPFAHNSNLSFWHFTHSAFSSSAVFLGVQSYFRLCLFGFSDRSPCKACWFFILQS